MTKRAIWINILKVVGGILIALIIGYFIFTTGKGSVNKNAPKK